MVHSHNLPTAKRMITLGRIILVVTLVVDILQPQTLKANLIFSSISGGKITTSVIQCERDIIYKSNRDNFKMVSQLDTGEYSKVNCGPACLQAIAGYLGKELTVSDINNFKSPIKLGYSQYDMMEFLDKFNISYKTDKVYSINTKLEICNKLVSLINENNILILAIDVGEISINKNSTLNGLNGKKGRTYSGKFNHYIICTGYLIVDNELFFQIYDPMEQEFQKERYYTLNEFCNAISGNWNGYLSFSKLGNNM